MMKPKKTKRGGARPGAGRTEAGTVALLVRPLAATALRMRAKAKREGKTLGGLLDEEF